MGESFSGGLSDRSEGFKSFGGLAREHVSGRTRTAYHNSTLSYVMGESPGALGRHAGGMSRRPAAGGRLCLPRARGSRPGALRGPQCVFTRSRASGKAPIVALLHPNTSHAQARSTTRCRGPPPDPPLTYARNLVPCLRLTPLPPQTLRLCPQNPDLAQARSTTRCPGPPSGRSVCRRSPHCPTPAPDAAPAHSPRSPSPGALNDTLSWTTIRPLGVLPLSARCRPADLTFEDGEAATGPPLGPAMWGTCNTVRRLNGQDGCDAKADPAACPSLDGPVYGEQRARAALKRPLRSGGRCAQAAAARLRRAVRPCALEAPRAGGSVGRSRSGPRAVDAPPPPPPPNI